MGKRIYIGIVMLLISGGLMAIEKDSLHYHRDGTKRYADTAIYQGIQLKLDIGNMAVEMIRTEAKVLSFEGAMSIRLKNRFYPTFEFGYANAHALSGGGHSDGDGAFMKVGLDVNGLRKHPESPNALLVGLRVGTGLQDYQLSQVAVCDPYWKTAELLNTDHQFRCDVWGEIVAGCQVQIWEGLMMGWYLRLKILFTRGLQNDDVMPYYIPGYGYRDQTNWGFNYYIGWKF